MNKNLLEAEMKRCGISQMELAEILGIERCTLWKKMNGSSEFKQSEISTIVKTLKIKNPTPIFFAD